MGSHTTYMSTFPRCPTVQGRANFAKTNEHLNAVDQLDNTLALWCRAPRQIATRNGRPIGMLWLPQRRGQGQTVSSTCTL
jgi:hypothetical protein